MCGSYRICEHKSFISYVLGLEEDGNKKAEMGNVTHKVSECLARAKLHYQETGLIGKFPVGDEYIGFFEPDNIFDISVVNKLNEMAYNYHKSISKNEWDETDLLTTNEWANKIVSFQNGAFDPRNKEVAHVEKFFDFEIEEDWAAYEYKIGDETFKGNLSLKGTIDLIMKVADDHYEVLDYKTGKRIDWATGKEKTYETLQEDEQLLMYYYACRKVFPDVKYFDFTIYYVNTGGPFTMCFDDSYYELAKNVIKNRFLEMKNNQRPKLAVPKQEERDKLKNYPYDNFKCKFLCSFNKHKYKDTDQTICEFFKNKVLESSADEVTAKYADISKIGIYGDGGGRKKE